MAMYQRFVPCFYGLPLLGFVLVSQNVWEFSLGKYKDPFLSLSKQQRSLLKVVARRVDGWVGGDCFCFMEILLVRLNINFRIYLWWSLCLYLVLRP